jgi:hypothetical protein
VVRDAVVRGKSYANLMESSVPLKIILKKTDRRVDGMKNSCRRAMVHTNMAS